MSRSDTDVDMIDATRPKYPVGRQVSFINMRYSTDVLVGIVASSKQIVHQNGSFQITYDISTSTMIFTNIPEENILKTPWPSQHNGNNGVNGYGSRARR